jgi:quercetin dioxygenase-like cupin family protein
LHALFRLPPTPQRKNLLMQKMSLAAIAREQLEAARRAPSSRASVTAFGGHEHALRQTVIALTAGAALDEHENPGEATVLVLSGRVELAAAGQTWQARQEDLLVVPDAVHALRALEDSVVLLTAVPRGHIR